jgi:hypothetical protein
MRTRVLGTQAALSTTSGNTFTNATVVRLINTATSGVTITLNENDDTTLVGVITLSAGQVEFLEKDSDQRVRGNTAVYGNKVGYTH